MKVEVYCLANNEEMLMPYFMRHYTQFADVILLESNSTDNTIKITKDMGGTVWSYNVPDEINDEWFMNIKNSCWKKSKADWVMVVDADEFIYHPNIVNVLETIDATAISPTLFTMFSDKFPTTEGQIYEEVTYGVVGGAKTNIFKPSQIKEINYNHGCHIASLTGNVNRSVSSGIITLHMRFLSYEWALNRNKRAASRLSTLNKKMGWGSHVRGEDKPFLDYFNASMLNLTKII